MVTMEKKVESNIREQELRGWDTGWRWEKMGGRGLHQRRIRRDTFGRSAHGVTEGGIGEECAKRQEEEVAL